MKYCKHCRSFFDDEDLILIMDDPSPSGVGLPPGSYVYAYCPICGSDDVDDFNLAEELDVSEGVAEELDVSEGVNDTSAYISFGGKQLHVYIDDRGILNCEWAV